MSNPTEKEIAEINERMIVILKEELVKLKAERDYYRTIIKELSKLEGTCLYSEYSQFRDGSHAAFNEVAQQAKDALSWTLNQNPEEMSDEQK